MNKKILEDDAVKIEILRLLNDDFSYREIAQRLGIPKSTLNDFILKRTYKDWWEHNNKPIATGQIYDHHTNMESFNKKRYILTSAQNNTFAHNSFFQSLECMADHIDAQIIVGTYSYNKHGFQNLQKGESDFFDPKLVPYIVDKPIQLADGLIWCGELNILPTAVNPLSGLHSYTKGCSGIIPHAKMQLESLPTHKHDPCRMMYTTGSVTQRNYIQKKAGQKASFHHIFGALLVEVDDDGDWFVRQLVADSETGEFYDLDTLYTPNGFLEETDSVEAINWGDIHVEKLNMKAASASFFDDNSMLNTLRPKYQLIHDVMDFQARNHHNIKDPYFMFQMHVEGSSSVRDNVRGVADFLKQIERPYTQSIVVESNHDLALRRWLKESDYKLDPENAIFYLENQLETYRQIQAGNTNFSVFGYAVIQENKSLKNVRFLKVDESFRICNDDGQGIECGSHGDIGANGGRGSIQTFQKLGTRYNVGHSHTAAIKDGVYYAGVLGNLDMGYNKGGSSWSHSNIVTYKNGKRTIVTIKNGKWRA